MHIVFIVIELSLGKNNNTYWLYLSFFGHLKYINNNNN